jgi:hypothetical protein
MGLLLPQSFLHDQQSVSREGQEALGFMVRRECRLRLARWRTFEGAPQKRFAGTGYTVGGNAITATEVTTPGGVLTIDGADISWARPTIANAMAGVGYFNVGLAATDQLVWLSDLVTAASTTNGTFTIKWRASGIITIEFSHKSPQGGASG